MESVISAARYIQASVSLNSEESNFNSKYRGGDGGQQANCGSNSDELNSYCSVNASVTNKVEICVPDITKCSSGHRS